MSKKPKHSRHRVPVLTMASDLITEDYQSQIDASMARLESRYHKADKALRFAEVKAERARIHAENLARKQVEAAMINANRLANEQALSENIARIREAAKNARVASARAELECQQREATAKRDALAAQREADAKAVRQRETLIARSRASFRTLDDEVAERRRELREITALMMPGSYAGRIHRGTKGARHTHGAA